MTNATLLQSIISNDGSLLQPSKPITAVDSSFLEEGSKPNGFLYGTHGLEMSWIFVSFQLREPFPVTLRDFWPPLQTPKTGYNDGATIRFVHRTFGSSRECIDGKDAIASGCVELVAFEDGPYDHSPIFVAPESSFVSPGSDLKPNVVTVWRECPGSTGLFFLGELKKYVAVSPKRFRSLECSEEGLSVNIVGREGEMIEITLVVPLKGHTLYKVVKDQIMVTNAEGFERFEYKLNHVVPLHSRVAVDETKADV